jgi:hypothetical protein
VEGNTVSVHFRLHSSFWFSEGDENVSDHSLFGFSLVDISLGFGPCTGWAKTLGGTSRQQLCARGKFTLDYLFFFILFGRTLLAPDLGLSFGSNL